MVGEAPLFSHRLRLLVTSTGFRSCQRETETRGHRVRGAESSEGRRSVARLRIKREAESSWTREGKGRQTSSNAERCAIKRRSAVNRSWLFCYAKIPFILTLCFTRLSHNLEQREMEKGINQPITGGQLSGYLASQPPGGARQVIAQPDELEKTDLKHGKQGREPAAAPTLYFCQIRARSLRRMQIRCQLTPKSN